MYNAVQGEVRDDKLDVFLNTQGTPTGGKGISAALRFYDLEIGKYEIWFTQATGSCTRHVNSSILGIKPESREWEICEKLKAMLDRHNKNIPVNPSIENQFYRTTFIKKDTGKILEKSSQYGNNLDMSTSKEVDTTDITPKLLPLFERDLKEFFTSNSR
jgi:hypothetical protein